jgi:hypothetical protein
MPLSPPENDYFLKTGDVVNIGIDLPDMTFTENVATVTGSEHGEIALQLCGDGFPQHMPIIAGSKVLISKGAGRTLFQCVSQLKSAEAKGSIRIDPPRRVVVCERREYMRMDVAVPVSYYLPQSQNMAKVIEEWENAKECNGGCHEETKSLPADQNCPVNLSGSGLRFKIRECLSYGTLLHLKIALPGEKPHHIHAVGSIIRTNKELPSEMNHVEYHSTAMSFRMIDNSDRQKLIRHILEEQRKSLVLAN